MDFQRRLPLITASAAAVVACYALYFVFPYSFGYGSSRISIATMVAALWSEYGNWEHGMLVLPIVGFLVWRIRGELAQIPIQGTHFGLFVLICSLLSYWLGYLTDIQYVGFISAQFYVAGVILWFLGWAHFWKLLFPWLFLMFAWPFLFLDQMIAFPLRGVMAELSYHVLNLIGLDSVRDGSAILSAPNPAKGLAIGEWFRVDIADPCSGIRSLFALTMLAALYGYFVFKKPWQLVMLMFSAVPLAVIGNLIRILILTFGVIWWGPDLAIGSIDNPSFYHNMAGFAVFGVALMGMLALAKLVGNGPGFFGDLKRGTAFQPKVHNPASVEI